MSIRIGTSGWDYPHWRGLFYPTTLRHSHWFAFYTTEFDTVELNTSFYRLPAEATYDAWRDQAPPGFTYAIMASRYLTHVPKPKEPADPLWVFFAHAARLQDHLGPIVHQLPPYWHADLPSLNSFLKSLPHGRTHVVEFHDQSWFTTDVFRLLERYNVAHCIHDLPPWEVPPRVTAGTVYLRLYGGRYTSGSYAHTDLEQWAERIRGWQAEGRQVWAYFGNDSRGFAIENARTLKGLLNAEA